MGKTGKGDTVSCSSGWKHQRVLWEKELGIWRRPGVQSAQGGLLCSRHLWPGSGQPGCIWNEVSEEGGDGDSKLVYGWLLGTRSLITRKTQISENKQQWQATSSCTWVRPQEALIAKLAIKVWGQTTEALQCWIVGELLPTAVSFSADGRWQGCNRNWRSGKGLSGVLEGCRASPTTLSVVSPPPVPSQGHKLPGLWWAWELEEFWIQDGWDLQKTNAFFQIVWNS